MPEDNVAHQDDKDFMTRFVLVLSVVVLLVAVVFLVTRLFAVVERAALQGQVDDAVAQERLEERIRPVGRVVTAAVEADDTPVRRSGAEVYRAVCAACHDTGAAGAPRKGDEALWTERLGQGLDTVVRHAIEGIGAMPARGGDPRLSDEEVRDSVVFLLAESGQDVGTDEAETAVPEEVAAEDEADAAEEAVAGDVSAGQSKYAASCASCHGAQGQGQAVFPRVAGTPAARIVELLEKYRAGEQVGPQTPLMAPNARNLSDEDIANLAAYLDTL